MGDVTDPVEVGVRVPHALLEQGPEALAAFVASVDDSEIDRLSLGDHVSFKGGQATTLCSERWRSQRSRVVPRLLPRHLIDLIR